jgi:multisubunit Na+/H+ antiporter MnhF subunit
MSAQWIEWFGEFALTVIGFGFLYVVIRMVDGPRHQPAIALPIVWRVVVALTLAVIATTARIWLSNRRKLRRPHPR